MPATAISRRTDHALLAGLAAGLPAGPACAPAGADPAAVAAWMKRTRRP